nr:unnamed protein product [Callosobruchus chinensis]CAH7762859.1 unnamed protein product [Callosobruchus chinensis]
MQSRAGQFDSSVTRP